jgi:hypothetical protein
MPDLRPLAWLATMSFALGFMGYLAVAKPPAQKAEVASATYLPAERAATSGPASEAWNFDKKL